MGQFTLLTQAGSPPLENHQQLSYLLNTLPAEFNEISQFITRIGRYTFDDAVKLLIDEECQLKIKTQQRHALKSHANHEPAKKVDKDYKSEKSHKNFNPIYKYCSYCGKPGHHHQQCRKRLRHSNFKPPSSTLLSANVQSISSISWILDSGASHHMTNDPDDFDKVTPHKSSIKFGDNSETPVTGIGELNLNVNEHTLELKNVLLAPKLKFKLLSIAQLIKQKICVIFEDETAILFHGKDLIARIQMNNNLYEVPTCNKASWHERLGHVSAAKLAKLGLKETPVNCGICPLAKQTKMKVTKVKDTKITSSFPFEIVHTDIGGPLTPSLGGSRFYITFVDDYSRYCTTYFMQRKSETPEVIESFLIRLKNKLNYEIKQLYSDNGSEYTSARVRQICKNSGISQMFSPPYTPQLNGIAERINRTLMEKTRSMILQHNHDQNLWSEALATATFIYNRQHHTTIDCSPYEKLYCHPPDLNQIQLWGCRAYVKIQRHHSKIERKSTPMIFLGYSMDSPGSYKLYDPSTKRISISRDVTFDETFKFNPEPEPPKQLQSRPSVEFSGFGEPLQAPQPIQLIQVNDQPNNNNEPVEPNAPIDEDPFLGNEVDPEINEIVEEDYEGNEIDLSKYSQEEIQFANAETESDESEDEPQKRIRSAPYHLAQNYHSYTTIKTPRNYSEAMNDDNWRQAINNEINSLLKLNTFEVVDIPTHKRPIQSKWVFKYKENENVYKARLVAKGYTQRKGIDYIQTFSPVIRFETVRLFTSIALNLNYKITQADIKTAFLNGKLQEELFLAPPPGFNIHPNKCLKLNKSLYGLKQANRVWSELLSTTLTSYPLTQSKLDPCLFFNPNLWILVYVDDLLIISKSPSDANDLLSFLGKKFSIKNLGTPTHFLGITLQIGKDSISFHQKPLINQLIDDTKMNDCKPVCTPMESISEELDPSPIDSSTPYLSTVGTLLFIATRTRPDIQFAVNYAARYNSNPTKSAWKVVKRIIRYLKGSIEYQLTFNKSDQILSAYCDADWGSSQTRKSTLGYCLYVGSNPISWRSELQKSIALSTMESEYVALSSISQEIMYFRQLITEISIFPKIPPTVIKIDNQAAINLAENSQITRRAKHIEIRYHYTRDLINSGAIHLKYTPSNENTADIFTKPLPRPLFNSHRSNLMLFEGNFATKLPSKGGMLIYNN